MSTDIQCCVKPQYSIFFVPSAMLNGLSKLYIYIQYIIGNNITVDILLYMIIGLKQDRMLHISYTDGVQKESLHTGNDKLFTTHRPAIKDLTLVFVLGSGPGNVSLDFHIYILFVYIQTLGFTLTHKWFM